MDEARLKRALETLLAEPQEHPEPGSGTLLVAYRLRDRPAIPTSVPCHILRTTYDAEHPAHLLLDRRPGPDDIMVYAFLGKQRLDRVLMALAPSSSNFFQVLVDNLGQEQQGTTEIAEAGEVGVERGEEVAGGEAAPLGAEHGLVAGGADAARHAAQLTLLNSDFSVMPEIVLEGRRVINNITRAASLFLTKTIFSFLLSLLILVLPAVYPFQPIQLTLISSLMIGLPGFVLALEPSGERIRGDFLRTVLYRALPGGIAAACCASISMAMTWAGWSHELCSTLATLCAGAICWIVLIRACLPLNHLRRALLLVTAGAFTLAFLLFGHIFFLVPLTGPAVALFGGLVLLGGGLVLLCDWILKRRT